MSRRTSTQREQNHDLPRPYLPGGVKIILLALERNNNSAVSFPPSLVVPPRSPPSPPPPNNAFVHKVKSYRQEALRVEPKCVQMHRIRQERNQVPEIPELGRKYRFREIGGAKRAVLYQLEVLRAGLERRVDMIVFHDRTSRGQLGKTILVARTHKKSVGVQDCES